MAPVILLWLMIISFKGLPHGKCSFVDFNTTQSSRISHSSNETLDSIRSLQNEREQLAVWRSEGVLYYGAKAVISAWMPKLVNPGAESSRGMIRIETGPEAIEVGWQVNPSLYGGDLTPQLYIYTKHMELTNDGSERSRHCWYDSCGFVATGPHPMRMPMAVGQSKVYYLFMDERGDWRLKVSNQEVGYWPRQRLSYLSMGADLIYWGGKLTSVAGIPSRFSQMGNGINPLDARRSGVNSAYLYGVMIHERQGGILFKPPHAHAYETDDRCYSVRYESTLGAVEYGGPKPDCR